VDSIVPPTFVIVRGDPVILVPLLLVLIFASPALVPSQGALRRPRNHGSTLTFFRVLTTRSWPARMALRADHHHRHLDHDHAGTR